MNQDQIASHYRQISARGANPVGLVVKLYDAILEDFRRALGAIAENDVERRTAVLNHALLVIAELESVLDHQRAGTIAMQLRGFYAVTRAMIVEANVRGGPERIEKLMGLYMPLRHAWEKVENDVATGQVVLPENTRGLQTQSISSSPASLDETERTNWNG
jgi:flagellar protein FliS